MPNPEEVEWADAIIARFTERAESVKKSGMPPLEGASRLKWRQQRQLDFQDFSMIGDADATLHEGVLTLTLDLRPQTSVTLPTDRNRTTPKTLNADAGFPRLSDADLQALAKDSQRFLTVVETIKPIDITLCPGFSLTHGYLA